MQIGSGWHKESSGPVWCEHRGQQKSFYGRLCLGFEENAEAWLWEHFGDNLNVTLSLYLFLLRAYIIVHKTKCMLLEEVSTSFDHFLHESPIWNMTRPDSLPLRDRNLSTGLSGRMAAENTIFDPHIDILIHLQIYCIMIMDGNWIDIHTTLFIILW